MVGNFRGGGKYGRYLPLPGIAFQNIGNTQKTSLHLPLMYRRTSTLAWLLPRDLWSKKKPALFRCGLFLCFLYASARTVTCGNGDGGNGGGADAVHGCCVLCHFYLSVLYSYIG